MAHVTTTAEKWWRVGMALVALSELAVCACWLLPYTSLGGLDLTASQRGRVGDVLGMTWTVSSFIGVLVLLASRPRRW